MSRALWAWVWEAVFDVIGRGCVGPYCGLRPAGRRAAVEIAGGLRSLARVR
jgi:hypothetical protein